jgi:hypothetical protein
LGGNSLRGESDRAADRTPIDLLEVLFDGIGGALVRAIRILTELFPSTPLPQEIPQPVELDVDVIEPSAIVGRQRRALLEQRMFFGDEGFDMLVQLLVVHAAPLTRE